MSKRRSEMSRSIFVLALLLIGLSFAGCRPNVVSDNGTTNNGTMNNPAANNSQDNQGQGPKTASSQLRRYLANVWARTGAGEAPSMLSDDTWHAVKEGAQVRTDDNGEGWLRLRDCMTVYVFQKSEMITAPCSKSEYTSGNVNCQLAGTSVYNNSCESRVKQIIETPSAEITLQGTWVSVTYLPAHQLTVTMVFKGEVSIRPVKSLEGRRLGEPVVAREGQFWLGVPDDRRAGISDLPAAREAGRPQSFDRLQPLLDALEMNEWRDRIWKRAEEDKLNPPRLTSPDEERRAAAAARLIDCDCQRVEANITGRPSRSRCLRVEQALRQQYVRTGKFEGTCDPVASGPNARPGKTPPLKSQPDKPRVGPTSPSSTITNKNRPRTNGADNSSQASNNRAVNQKPPQEIFGSTNGSFNSPNKPNKSGNNPVESKNNNTSEEPPG